MSGSMQHLRRRFSDRTLGTAAAVLAILLVSPDALIIRVVDVDSWTILFWRSPFVAAGLFAIGRLTSGGSVYRQLRAAGPWGLVVTVGSAASMVLWVVAIKETAVANALVVFATTPLFAALFARLLLRERLAPQTWAALAAATAAVIALVAGGVEGGGTTGNLAALGATLSVALMIVGLRRTRALPMLQTVAVSQLVVLAVAAVPADPTGAAAGDVLLIAGFGIVAFAPGVALFTLAPSLAAAGEVGLVMPFEAVVGSAWVWIWLDEAPTAAALASGAVIIGVLLAHSLWLARNPDPPPPTASLRQSAV